MKVESLYLDNHFREINRWITPSDPSTNLHNAQTKRQEGTCSWLLESRPFNEWKSKTRRHLWLHGIPGCGKTILCSAIVDHILNQDTQHIVLYFFFDSNTSNKLSLDNLLRSLVVQLYTHCENSQKELDKLFKFCTDGSRQPETRELSATLQLMMGYANNTHVIIDAIDECKTRRDLLSWIEGFLSCSSLDSNLLATSRTGEEIESKVKDWLEQDSFISIQREAVNNDIQTYVHNQLRENHEFSRWDSHQNVLDRIENTIMKKADGMYVLTCNL